MRRRGWPTLTTLGVLLVVFVLQRLFGIAGWSDVFVLAPPLDHRPWTAVTSVYAHLDLTHLVGNAISLAILGPLVARRTTARSFHAYFVATGALAAVAEVFLGGLLWSPSPVLGASGAIFALLGYLLGGNVVSTVVLDRIALSARAQLAVFLAIAVVVTLATAGARTAIIGHASGLLCGLVAGRLRLIDRSRA